MKKNSEKLKISLGIIMDHFVPFRMTQVRGIYKTKSGKTSFPRFLYFALFTKNKVPSNILLFYCCINEVSSLFHLSFCNTERTVVVALLTKLFQIDIHIGCAQLLSLVEACFCLSQVALEHVVNTLVVLRSS